MTAKAGKNMIPGTDKKGIRDVYGKHRETIFNFFWRTIQILGRQGVTFIIFLLCARILTPYEFGIYNYIFSLIFMFALLSDFGLSITVSRYTAEYTATKDPALKELMFNATALMVAISVAVCILVVLFRNYIQYYRYILYCLPMLLFVPLTSLFDGLYRGVKKFRELSLINFTIGMLFLPFIYLFVKKWGLEGAIVAQNIFYILLFTAFASFSFVLKIKHRYSLNRSLVSRIVKYSLLVGLSNVGLFLYTRADILVLAHFNLIEEIGYYEVVNRVFMILLFPAQILATIVAPKIAGIFAQKKGDMIRRNYFRDMKLLPAAGVLLTVLVFLIMESVFRFVFSNYDTDTIMYLMTLLLCLIPFRYFSTYITIGYITPSGNVIILTVFILLFGLLNVILDFALAPQFGLKGVVFATLLSQLLFMMAKDYAFYRLVIRQV